MPRIPNREVEDDFDGYEEFSVDQDDPTDRAGRKLPAKEHRKNRDYDEARKDHWRRKFRDDY